MTLPPVVRVWPAITRLVTGLSCGRLTVDVINVDGVVDGTPFTMTAFPVGDREIC